MRFFRLLLLFILVGCKPSSYFNTSNDIFEKEGIVYLLNGSSKTGKISIQFETGREAHRSIRLKNGDVQEELLVDSIRSYYMDGDNYFPKLVALDFEGTERLLFVKRLSADSSRIHLYELFQSRAQSADGADFMSYYISLPTQSRLETWLVGGSHLVPNFDEKMSKLVEDCATLSGKIKRKDNGYHLGPLTVTVAKAKIMKRIVDEYNDCR